MVPDDFSGFCPQRGIGLIIYNHSADLCRDGSYVHSHDSVNYDMDSVQAGLVEGKEELLISGCKIVDRERPIRRRMAEDFSVGRQCLIRIARQLVCELRGSKLLEELHRGAVVEDRERIEKQGRRLDEQLPQPRSKESVNRKECDHNFSVFLGNYFVGLVTEIADTIQLLDGVIRPCVRDPGYDGAAECRYAFGDSFFFEREAVAGSNGSRHSEQAHCPVSRGPLLCIQQLTSSQSIFHASNLARLRAGLIGEGKCRGPRFAAAAEIPQTVRAVLLILIPDETA